MVQYYNLTFNGYNMFCLFLVCKILPILVCRKNLHLTNFIIVGCGLINTCFTVIGGGRVWRRPELSLQNIIWWEICFFLLLNQVSICVKEAHWLIYLINYYTLIFFFFFFFLIWWIYDTGNCHILGTGNFHCMTSCLLIESSSWNLMEWGLAVERYAVSTPNLTDFLLFIRTYYRCVDIFTYFAVTYLWRNLFYTLSFALSPQWQWVWGLGK